MICFVAYLVTTTYSYLSIQEQRQTIGSTSRTEKGYNDRDTVRIQSEYSQDTVRVQPGYSKVTARIQ